MKLTMHCIKLRWIALGIVSFLINDVRGQETGTITGMVTMRGLRNAADVVVYIDKIPGRDFEPPNEHAVMDQINLKFVPHVLPILVGTSVDFPNSDEVRHNVFTPSEVGGKFNLGQYPKGVVKTVTFPEPGIVVLLCNVHTEMSAYVVVSETPYFAVTEVKPGQRTGEYTIKDVPPGTYVLKAWHRKAEESTQRVEVPSNGTATVDFTLTRKE